MKSSILNVTGIDQLTAGELSVLTAAAHQLGIHPDWLATVISYETAGTFSPSIVNRAGSGAFGLIQFLPSTARNLLKTATNDDAVRIGRAMTFSEQMRRMVIPYFSGRSMKSLEDVYLAVFYPAAMNKPGNWVIGSAPGAVYEQNRGFDKAGKGWITRDDVTATIRRVYERAGGARRSFATGVIVQVIFGCAVGAGLIWSLARHQLQTFIK